jgi:hypothetical protein
MPLICLFCFATDGCMLTFDRRNRPTVYCACCGTRLFLKTSHALRGIAVMQSEVLPRVLERIKTVEGAQAVASQVSAFQAQLAAAQTPPVPRAPAVTEQPNMQERAA